MHNLNSPLAPEVYLADVFNSKAVQKGEVIRRKARDIERFAGMDLFLREIHRRGFHVVENSGQFVIFCNRAPVRWITAPPEPLSLKESDPKSFEDFGARQRSDERPLPANPAT